jgi:hypothetical protein
MTIMANAALDSCFFRLCLVTALDWGRSLSAA